MWVPDVEHAIPLAAVVPGVALAVGRHQWSDSARLPAASGPRAVGPEGRPAVQHRVPQPPGGAAARRRGTGPRKGGATDALREQRKLTDKAIAGFRSPSDTDTDDAPGEVRDAVGEARRAITQLPAQRALVYEGDVMREIGVLEDCLAAGFSGPVAEAPAEVTGPEAVVYSRISQVTVEEPWHVGRAVLAGDAAREHPAHHAGRGDGRGGRAGARGVPGRRGGTSTRPWTCGRAVATRAPCGCRRCRTRC